jgi:hypothetical protein
MICEHLKQQIFLLFGQLFWTILVYHFGYCEVFCTYSTLESGKEMKAVFKRGELGFVKGCLCFNG